ncbi:MAG: efflux RND transporter permease subunit, partial [Myxococcota bacterium]
GTPAFEAVRLASYKRFRPILLTTVTTVTGLAPMALGISGYSRVFAPFATAIVFGLSVASLLTLFLVPTLYLGVDDLTSALRRIARPARRRAPGMVRVPVGRSGAAGGYAAQKGQTMGIKAIATTPQTRSRGSPTLTKSMKR